MTKIELSADEVIDQISETLREADGEFIEKIAHQVLGDKKVKYQEDSIFILEVP
ncbi:MAG: hypothetical protein M0R32_02480 [Candidatus Cloacimonetes bacterium]|jgi:hypothetical protein|nr:hypothetical protein [Candidatus Cloacimonadota bacterium]